LWYYQQVEGRRPDVTVVTLPLLGARWYREELDRRHHLLAGDAEPAGEAVLAQRIADAARAIGRPVAVAMTVPDSERNYISDKWRVIGVPMVSPSGSDAINIRHHDGSSVTIDSTRTLAAVILIDAWRHGHSVHEAPDPV